MIQEKNDNVLIGHINELQDQIDTLSGDVSTLSALAGGGCFKPLLKH